MAQLNLQSMMLVVALAGFQVLLQQSGLVAAKPCTSDDMEKKVTDCAKDHPSTSAFVCGEKKNALPVPLVNLVNSAFCLCPEVEPEDILSTSFQSAYVRALCLKATSIENGLVRLLKVASIIAAAQKSYEPKKGYFNFGSKK